MSNIKIILNRKSSSISNNTSVMDITVKMYSDASWNNDPCSGYVIVDGTRHNFSHSFGKGTTTIYHGTQTVNHNADGSKVVNAKASFTTGTSLGTLTDSASLTLKTIPQGTEPELQYREQFIGNQIKISTPRKSTSFHHTLRYKFKNKTGTIATKVTTSCVWDIPKSLASEIPNSDAGTCYVYCDTYVEGKSDPIETKYTSFKLKAGATFNPEITSITVSESIQAVHNAFGKLVQNESRINVNINAKGSYGSTIKTYKTTISGETFRTSSFRSPYLKNAGNVGFTCYVRDSRGKTAELRKDITVLAYSEPEISSLSSERCNSDGTSNDEGNALKVSIKGRVSSIQNNTKSLVLSYKKVTDTQWTDVTIPLSSWNFDVDYIINNTVYDESYNLKATLKDKLNSDVSSSQTGRIALSLLAGGKGAKFFGEADREGFYVNDTKFPLEIKSATGSGQVAAGEYKVLASIPVTKGTYLVSGYALWRTAFAKNKLVSLSLSGGGWTRLEHDSGDSQGGKTITARVTVAGDNNIELKVKHADSSTHTIIESSLDVIRLSGTKETSTKYNLQAKAVTPKSEEQTVFADSGYYGLSSVTVKGVQNGSTNDFANAIRIRKTGNKIIADDLSFLEHNIKCHIIQNLIHGTVAYTEFYGVTISHNFDGSYTLNGTGTTTAILDAEEYFSLSAGDYELHANNDNIINSSYDLVQVYSPSTGAHIDTHSDVLNGVRVKNLPPANDYRLRIRIEAGQNYDNLTLNPVLIKKGEAVDYSAVVVTANGMNYRPNYSGAVDGIEAKEKLTIETDRADIVINCEYVADTKKYIDKKFNELAKATINNIG